MGMVPQLPWAALALWLYKQVKIPYFEAMTLGASFFLRLLLQIFFSVETMPVDWAPMRNIITKYSTK